VLYLIERLVIQINQMVAEGLLFLIQIFYIVLFARIILSWFMVGGGDNQALQSIYRIVYNLTEPLLAPIRKIIPGVRVGMGYLDLSPIILLILLRIVQQIIIRSLLY
jgi:YggT family protein